MIGQGATTQRGADMSENEPEKPRDFALIGIIFAIVLAVGALYLVNRMRHWAAMGDCAFTHAPACRELIDR
jgi:hypothetical protein